MRTPGILRSSGPSVGPFQSSQWVKSLLDHLLACSIAHIVEASEQSQRQRPERYIAPASSAGVGRRIAPAHCLSLSKKDERAGTGPSPNRLDPLFLAVSKFTPMALLRQYRSKGRGFMPGRNKNMRRARICTPYMPTGSPRKLTELQSRSRLKPLIITVRCSLTHGWSPPLYRRKAPPRKADYRALPKAHDVRGTLRRRRASSVP